jgi:hypothetical protein
MAHSAFFAWQLDTSAEHNKKFIWDALVQATSRTTSSTMAEAAPRPESDTAGLPGSPNIVATVFERIAQCAFFVADFSFVAESPSRNKLPNPNVAIELGFAARSLGWNRTILVINNAYDEAKDLPFDILQHRWPIEYRVTPETKVGAKRFEQLSDALAAAIADCEKSILIRAREMADKLDAATIDFVAQNEHNEFMAMRDPPTTMTGFLIGEDHILAVRHLFELGALRVTNTPYCGYTWTYDGCRMIEALKDAQGPMLLDAMRQWRQQFASQVTIGCPRGGLACGV